MISRQEIKLQSHCEMPTCTGLHLWGHFLLCFSLVNSRRNTMISSVFVWDNCHLRCPKHMSVIINTLHRGSSAVNKLCCMMGLWAIWSSARCPCPQQGNWNQIILEVLFNPVGSMDPGLCLGAGGEAVPWDQGSHSRNMASRRTKQQMKLSKSMFMFLSA